MENQLKDEQIQRQSETIASLERKVESLEKELQKHLDPDSGEFNPQWKPQQSQPKTGALEMGEDHLPPLSDDPSFQKFLDLQIEDPKAALLQQIADLQKQLDVFGHYLKNHGI